MADAEFSQNACEGARDNAKKHGFKIVYDKSYPPPPKTTDFAPIVRAIKAVNADLVVVCAYPLDSVGMVLAANEVGLTPKMFGGALVGLQATVFKDKLKGKLNGIVNYETWVPDEKEMYTGTEAFFKEYQSRAKAEGVDPLGYYLGGWGYAYIQILGDAVKGAKSINDDKIADYLRTHTFDTVMGPIKFGAKGEWAVEPDADGAVSRHQGRREPGDLARHELPDRAGAGRPGDRQGHLSLREGAQVSAPSTNKTARELPRRFFDLSRARRARAKRTVRRRPGLTFRDGLRISARFVLHRAGARRRHIPR